MFRSLPANLGPSLILTAALGCATQAHAASPPVLLGGTSNMTDMVTAANTDAFRAAGGGLYAHQSGWVVTLQTPGEQPNSASSQARRKSIVDLFRPNNVGEVEFSYGTPSDWTNTYNAYYKANGLTADVASVNFLSGRDDGNTSSNYPASNAAAFAYVDALRSVGISTVNIILSPNNNATDATTYNFANAHWDDARTRALYGGGWTSDAPPAYFFGRDQNYRDWVIAQTKWTNANGLHSTTIISPHTSGANFFADSVKYVRYFEEHDAIPTQWVVENYSYVGEPPAGYVNRIGSEDDVNNLGYTAKWLIGHVQGRAQSLDLYSSNAAGNTGKGQFSTTPANNKVTFANSGAAQNYTVNLANLGTGANDFYAAELAATVTGDASHWSYVFKLNGVDVTAAILGDGYQFSGSAANILEAAETGAFTLTVQRLAGATGSFGLNLFAKANPSATVFADTLSFVSAVPEPASALALAAAGAIMSRRKRRDVSIERSVR